MSIVSIGVQLHQQRSLHRQTDRWIDGQRHRKTDRETDRQKDRQRETHRERQAERDREIVLTYISCSDVVSTELGSLTDSQNVLTIHLQVSTISIPVATTLNNMWT